MGAKEFRNGKLNWASCVDKGIFEQNCSFFLHENVNRLWGIGQTIALAKGSGECFMRFSCEWLKLGRWNGARIARFRPKTSPAPPGKKNEAYQAYREAGELLAPRQNSCRTKNLRN